MLNAYFNGQQGIKVRYLGEFRDLSELIAAKADLDALSERSGSTALIAAVYHGQQEAVQALIKAGANPNTQSRGGETALHVAVHVRNEKIITFLLEHEAIPEIKDNHGITARQLAPEFFNQHAAARPK